MHASEIPSIFEKHSTEQKMAKEEKILTLHPGGKWKDGFKLIAYPNANKLRLFDLADDPLEMNDLSENSNYKPIVEKLFQELLVLQKQMNDPLDLKKFISY